MKKVALLFSLIALMALSTIGFGFAKWSSGVDGTVYVQTGFAALSWVDRSMMQRDNGPDWHAEQGLIGSQLDTENKDVAYTTGTFTDMDNDTFLDSFNITVNNAYPYYYNEVSGVITNSGTIPLIIQTPVLHWMGHAMVIGDNFVYWLGKDGQIIMPTAEQIATPLKVNDNWVLELRWMDNKGKQIHPGEFLKESFDFQVLEGADQNTSYNIRINVTGLQWNEAK